MNVYSTIELEIGQGIATIWFNRSGRRNAFDAIMLQEIREAVIWAGNNEGIKALFIRGRGAVFCAGADLNWMKEAARKDGGGNVEDAQLLTECFKTIYKCPKPVVTLVHKACMGGANGIVAASDMVIAEEETAFSFSEVRLGLVPATIGPFVIRRIGEVGARDLMLSGRKFDAATALRYHLINEVAGKGKLDDGAEVLKQNLLQAGPGALIACKEMIAYLAKGPSQDVASAKMTQLIADIRATKEAQEGLSAFLEKRKPNWIHG